MPFVKEQVFTNSTPSQAQEYHDARGIGYPAAIYEHVLSTHRRHGGETNLVVDIGCGPGNAARDLLSYFDNVIGIDGSKSMIDTARSLVSSGTPPNDRIRFETIPAEQVDQIPGVKEGSIDMITAATAAHWFDLQSFYPAALRALKPGGTIAFWIRCIPVPHPDQLHADEIVAIVKELWAKLTPYRQTSASRPPTEKPGNVVDHGEYLHLPLPWTCDTPIDGFDQDSFQRVMFSDENGNQALPGYEMTVSQAERALGVGSPIMKWREMHPDLVGTDDDIVKSHFNRVRRLLGVEDAAIKMNMRFAVLTWKKA